MTFNYLFYLGVIIPSVITIALFATFIYCWYRYRLRQNIIKKKHDPHGKLKSTYGKLPEPPPPPDWDLIEKMKICEEELKRQEGKLIETAETPDSQTFYSTFHDSGMTEMTEIHCKSDCDLHNYNHSTDSDDSGFTSSRSVHYIHSASNSNAQDQSQYNSAINTYNLDEFSKQVQIFQHGNDETYFQGGNTQSMGVSQSAIQPLFSPLHHVTDYSNYYPQYSPAHSVPHNKLPLLEYPTNFPSQCVTKGAHHIQMSSDPVKSLSNTYNQDRLVPQTVNLKGVSNDQVLMFRPIQSAQSNTSQDQIVLKPICHKSDEHNKKQVISALASVHDSPIMQSKYMCNPLRDPDIDLEDMYALQRQTNIPTVSGNTRQMTITTAMVHHPNIHEATTMSYSVV